jgi:hypothetical protein
MNIFQIGVQTKIYVYFFENPILRISVNDKRSVIFKYVIFALFVNELRLSMGYFPFYKQFGRIFFFIV